MIRIKSISLLSVQILLGEAGGKEGGEGWLSIWFKRPSQVLGVQAGTLMFILDKSK